MSDILHLQGDDGIEDSLETYVRGGRLHISVENPYAGDTQTGFGRTCHVSLSPSDAIRLLQWLQRNCAESVNQENAFVKDGD